MGELKLIVAGGREFNDYHRLSKVLFDYAETITGYDSISIVSGMARGADALAYRFAKTHSMPCHEFPANWDKHGKSAGYIRNTEMANFADALVAFWDGKSRGTKHMIETMQKLGKPVQIEMY